MMEFRIADDIACWFIDADYNEESFLVRHVLPWCQRSLQCPEEDVEGRDQSGSLGDAEQRYDTAVHKPRKGRIAVKVINRLDDEVMKVSGVN